MRIFTRLAAVALATLIGGCALFPNAHDRAVRNNPSFRAGYGDGCAASNAAGTDYRKGPVRDRELYDSDATYRAGWSSGYSTCRRTNASPGSSPGDNPIPQPGPGH